MFGGSDFRGSGQNLPIELSPEMYGIFSKIFIKINKNLKIQGRQGAEWGSSPPPKPKKIVVENGVIF